MHGDGRVRGYLLLGLMLITTSRGAEGLRQHIPQQLVAVRAPGRENMVSSSYFIDHGWLDVHEDPSPLVTFRMK